MESVYETEVEEIFEDSTETFFLPDAVEALPLEDISAETSGTVVYYVTSPTSEEDNTQSADIVTCLVVIILLFGVACGIALGRILWERFK